MLKPANSSMKCSLLLLCMLVSAPSYASFLNTNVDFTYSDDVPTTLVKSGVPVVDPGRELFGTDGSPIDLGVLYDDEYIDIGGSSIVFGLRGGAAAHSNGYETWDVISTGMFRIDFETGTLALFETLTAADVVLTDIIGVTLGTQLIANIGLDFLTLKVGTLGINAIADFGTVALNFTAKPPSAVPIPAALPLMLSGLALIGFLSRRRRAC